MKWLVVSLCIAVAFAGGWFVRTAVPLEDDELIRRFSVMYYDRDSWSHMKWLGVTALQNPPDMWVIQELITELKPDVIIEAGTYMGGSALYMAMVMEGLQLPGKIITIDVKPSLAEAQKNRFFQERVESIVSSSTEPELVAKLRERTAGKNVFVMLDSLHTRDHVLAELEAYAPMVPVGGYIVVQDTNVNGHPVNLQHGPGPWEAVHDFLAKHPEWEIDKKREKFMLTFTPDGYLRRVK